MGRILRGLGMALLALAAVYAGDYLSLRFHIPASRQGFGSVQVQTLYAVKQKSGKLEYSLGDTETETCVRSVFPQMGMPPCWYLEGHATRQIQIGQAPDRFLTVVIAATRDTGSDRSARGRSTPESRNACIATGRWRDSGGHGS